MATNARTRLQSRVIKAAEAVLAERQLVSQVDILVGIGWLAGSHVDSWRQGRVPHLESVPQVDPSKISAAMEYFREWARGRGLHPSETAYVARTRDRRALQFSEGGDPETELAYRTHWLSPDLSPKSRERTIERQSKPPDLVVISPRKEFTCAECGEPGGGLLLMEDSGPVCLECADLGHLVFLPAGDAALTRRAKSASRLSAVVVRFSTARKRYERQGVLVEEPALADAEQRCLADEASRERRRERDRVRRKEQDLDLQKQIADEIRRAFPRCPEDRAESIAHHTSLRGSGRIGRTAAARVLDPDALTLAVVASIRHQDTAYEELLMAGVDRQAAREEIRSDVQTVLESWR